MEKAGWSVREKRKKKAGETREKQQTDLQVGLRYGEVCKVGKVG